MGAALKMDATRIRVAEFWKVQGDPLARALRRKFKSQHQFPKRKFKCVYSDELLKNRGDPSLLNHELSSSKAQINGTVVHITAIFGFMLAGLVMEDIVQEALRV